MKKFWYIKTRFCAPYQEMVVSQNDSESIPQIWNYNEHVGAMDHEPLFKVEFMKYSYNDQWVCIAERENAFICLPENTLIEYYELYSVGASMYPPGFIQA